MKIKSLLLLAALALPLTAQAKRFQFSHDEINKPINECGNGIPQGFLLLSHFGIREPIMYLEFPENLPKIICEAVLKWGQSDDNTTVMGLSSEQFFTGPHHGFSVSLYSYQSEHNDIWSRQIKFDFIHRSYEGKNGSDMGYRFRSVEIFRDGQLVDTRDVSKDWKEASTLESDMLIPMLAVLPDEKRAQNITLIEK